LVRESKPIPGDSEESDGEYRTVGPGVPVAPKATSKTGHSKGFSFGLALGNDYSDEEENDY